MADFKFKLNAVLEYRKAIEDQRKKELAELKELLRREQTLLKNLDRKKKEIQERMKCKQKEVVNVEDLIQYCTYLSDCKEKIVAQIEVIKQLIEDVESKREVLVSASKDRKIIEKLKDNQYQEFKSNLEKMEAKILDEIATTGYNYKNNTYARI